MFAGPLPTAASAAVASLGRPARTAQPDSGSDCYRGDPEIRMRCNIAAGIAASVVAASADGVPRMLLLPAGVGGYPYDRLRIPGPRGYAEAAETQRVYSSARWQPQRERTGGRILVDQLASTGSSWRSASPARAISPCSTRCTTPAIRFIVCRQEGGAADDGRGLGQAHRPAGHLLRHPRAGRHQRQRRRAHRAGRTRPR